MSKEQAKGFFEAISRDKQLAEEVKDVMGGQATNQEKAKKLLSLAKRHNFNFTEDELKTSLSIDDLADVSGGMWSSLGRFGLSVLNMLGVGGGGNQPAPQPVAPIVNVQQVTGNAQNQEGQQEGGENEVPPEAADVESDVEEIRELTLGELLERREREASHEPEEMIAQALSELNEDDIDRGRDTQGWFSLSRRVFSNVHGAEELVQRLERLERIYPRVRNYIITSRTDSSQHDVFDDEIKEWLRLICDSGKNVNVSLQDLIAEADFFIDQATEATRSRLLAISPGTEHLAKRMRNAQIGDEVQQRIIDFCENASAIASGDNVSLEELQELLEEAYSLGEEATAIISSHFVPAPKPETADDENEVEEIRELTPEEIAERQRREEQRRRELEERLARGPLELEESEPNWFEDDGTNRLIREFDDKELINRVNRLNTLYYRLLYAPQSRALMDRIRNYIATVGFTFDRGTESLQEQISIADALIHEAEEMLQSAEQQRGEEIREEIQQGLDALALILQRTHTGRPGETDLYTDVQTFLANRESYTREERIARARELLDRTETFHYMLDWDDSMFLDDAFWMFGSCVYSWDDDEQERLEEHLEKNALPWLASIHMQSCAPGEPALALEIQEFLTTIDDDFTDEHLAEMNSLLDRAREIMMNRARAYTRFDTDQMHIRNNDLQLAQMLGIDKEYIQEKIKNKIKMSANDITGMIELLDGDTVMFNFMVGSGTLVLTGSGNTVIGNRYDNDSLWRQLEEAGIVFGVDRAPFFNWRIANVQIPDDPHVIRPIIGNAAVDRPTNKHLPTPDHPFVVRNLIIGNGIAGVGEDAFSPARTFRSVYFMGPIQFIGDTAFASCDHLVEIGFAQPEKLERLDKEAFAFNNVLTSINIPQNANIHERAFYECDKLKKQGCPYCGSSDEAIDSDSDGDSISDTESSEDI